MINILSHNMLKTYLLSNFQYDEQHLKVKDLEMAYNLNQLQETNMMVKFLPTMTLRNTHKLKESHQQNGTLF
jgi:hypothetical protein